MKDLKKYLNDLSDEEIDERIVIYQIKYVDRATGMMTETKVKPKEGKFKTFKQFAKYILNEKE